MADHDAWRELAEIYVSLQMWDVQSWLIQHNMIRCENTNLYDDFFARYKQAAFCYEELILAQPTIPLYHLAYAEVSGPNTATSANK